MLASIYKYKPISTKLIKGFIFLHDPEVLDEFDYESNWTQATRVICPAVRLSVFDFVFTVASTCIYDADLKIFV